MSQSTLVINPTDARKSGTVAANPIKERRSLTSDILNSVGECVYEWDIKSDAITWSDGAETLFCLEDTSRIATSRTFNSLLLATTESTRNNTIMSSKEVDDGRGVAYRVQYALSAKMLNTASDIWIEDTGRWFVGENGIPVRAHGVIRIINERRNMEERIDRLSKFDPLTGIFNRPHLNLCLENTFEEINRSGEPASFIVVGLEHFDLINSVYGYEGGDAVITEVAKRLNENLRDNDIVGRFSGAKIGIILPECGERDMLIAGYRILNLLRENIIVTSQGPIAISISIGGVVMPQQARDSRQVFVAAQQALLESRRARESSIVTYRHNPGKDAKRRQDALIAKRIITALKEGHIHLAFQPIVDAKTSKVSYHEALVRLHSPDGDTLIAEDFVGIAQRLGLIRLVDHHALDLAIDVLISSPTAHFSLNVSNETACDPEWLSKLAIAIHRTPSIAGRLIIEITESHAAESMEEALGFINSVKDLGCKVALDDFGAGFTSFRNLKSLPFDIIKVDGQFVNNLTSSHENQSFIKALVGLARLFNVETVVEWVEDEKTAQLLNSWGVDYLQGFAFGKPQKELPWPIAEAPNEPQKQSS
ncbi:MAG: bifunctional diguanylate cyclase/phosphodiesterase [Rhizobiaceae bacterium]